MSHFTCLYVLHLLHVRMDLFTLNCSHFSIFRHEIAACASRQVPWRRPKRQRAVQRVSDSTNKVYASHYWANRPVLKQINLPLKMQIGGLVTAIVVEPCLVWITEIRLYSCCAQSRWHVSLIFALFSVCRNSNATNVRKCFIPSQILLVCTCICNRIPHQISSLFVSLGWL